jgi:hypothetical protein
MSPYPGWFEALACSYLALCFLCALIMLTDEIAGNRQKMMVMNLVWLITALYWGPVALWGYFTAGRKMTQRRQQQGRKANGIAKPNKREIPAGPRRASSSRTPSRNGSRSQPAHRLPFRLHTAERDVPWAISAASGGSI